MPESLLNKELQSLQAWTPGLNAWVLAGTNRGSLQLYSQANFFPLSSKFLFL